MEAMQSDLNTAGALRAIFELVRALNSAIDSGELGRADVGPMAQPFSLAITQSGSTVAPECVLNRPT